MVAPLLMIPITASETDHPHARGQALGLLQVVEGRQQFIAGEIAGGTKNYKGAVLDGSCIH